MADTKGGKVDDEQVDEQKVDKVDDEQGGEQGDEQAGERTFTQEDVDRIVEERLARERKKFADYDDLKAEAGKVEAIKDEHAKAIEEAVAQARAEITDELTLKFARERVADRIEVAATGRFADVEDARLRLGSRADEFIKGGEVDVDGIAAAVDEVLENNPHLAARPDIPSRERAGIGTGHGPAKPEISPGYDRLRHAYSTDA